MVDVDVGEPEVVEQASVHGHGPDDVHDAKDDGAVDGATWDAETVDAADDGEA
jgi:hypothetical protein